MWNHAICIAQRGPFATVIEEAKKLLRPILEEPTSMEGVFDAVAMHLPPRIPWIVAMPMWQFPVRV